MPERDARMSVILCWHMHQPEYRDLDTGDYRLPWTLLHALKDYVDMAAHLEAQPAARAVVNWAPVLLEQVADLCARIERSGVDGPAMGEPLLDVLAGRIPTEPQARAALVRQCQRANERRVIARFPAYAHLVDIAAQLEEADSTYVSDRFVRDLVVWYLLAWMGESVRRDDARVQALQSKARDFDAADCAGLLALVHELLHGLFARYRALAEAGRIELAMSPYAHPILPLLQDSAAGREALPESPLPAIDGYPGGHERARWQLRKGREVFGAHFGLEPSGCWPSEGALSTATVALLAEEGFRWCASGGGVLGNSLAAAAAAGTPVDVDPCQHRMFQVAGHPIGCFFRDDGLSDLIGFSYSDWHADDAVANLLHHMQNIADACTDCHNCAIVVILDGENAWEHYPENAWHFIDALYAGLAAHPRLEPNTFAGFLERNRPRPLALPALVAGSWVYGTLSTWVGSAEKNRGWELLAEAKRAYDDVLATGRLDDQARAAAERVLAVCEGSDWFWWFGDYNPAQAVSDFERQFRAHLGSLYRVLGVPEPPSLAVPVAVGHGDPALGGVMRPGTQ